MDALDALHNRISVNLLEGPAPTEKQLENIFKAGLRACDHMNLRPWKFLLIRGDARHKFGDLMAATKEAQNSESPCLEETLIKLKNKPLRAPLIITVIADIKQHNKVPEIEQVLSTGAAAQMMMTAAYAQGLGAIWRSGSLMFEQKMKDGLGLTSKQQLVGFLYLGQAKARKNLPALKVADFVSDWVG